MRLRRRLGAGGDDEHPGTEAEPTVDPQGVGEPVEPSSTTRRGRRLASPARTFPAAFPLLRLDRVYVRGFRIASAQVLSGPTWRKLSDHAPIVAELVLASRPAA